MAIRVIPSVNYSAIPERFQGLWVVLRVGESGQQVIGEGDTPEQARLDSRTSSGDLSTILTQVPILATIHYVGGRVEE